MRYPRFAVLAGLFLGLSGATGCLFRSHPVQVRMTTATLQSATEQDLIERVNREAAKIHSMNATVDIDTSVGGAKKGKVTEYQEIRGYLLARKPSMLRMVGLFPIVRNTAFDMVSNGKEFKLWIPPKNRFVIGRNEVTEPSSQPLENLRPQHISDALLLHSIDPKDEIAVLEGGKEIVLDEKTRKPVEQPNYELLIIRRDPAKNQWFLARKIYFSRIDLSTYRQVIYDRMGNVATDATYEDFQPIDGTTFPRLIRIWRPQEEYTVALHIVKLDVNKSLSDERFALKAPAGSTLINLDERQRTNGAARSGGL